MAETYRRDVLDLDPGVEPWSELVAYRNKLAHALPGDLSTDRVYADSRADPVRLLARIRDERP
ncbi:MAG: hypothetical protein H0U48_03560 [Euzebyaceae bacterium]|nr:hypothetical protein [Euzebyaceae bacterium]